MSEEFIKVTDRQSYFLSSRAELKILIAFGRKSHKINPGQLRLKKIIIVKLRSRSGLRSALCSESGAAAADLLITTDFLLFITILKSKICVQVFQPFII